MLIFSSIKILEVFTHIRQKQIAKITGYSHKHLMIKKQFDILFWTLEIKGVVK